LKIYLIEEGLVVCGIKDKIFWQVCFSSIVGAVVEEVLFVVLEKADGPLGSHVQHIIVFITYKWAQ
jgi:hypothetical protein